MSLYNKKKMKKFLEMKNVLLLEKNLRTVVEPYKIKTNAKNIKTIIIEKKILFLYLLI